MRLEAEKRLHEALTADRELKEELEELKVII